MEHVYEKKKNLVTEEQLNVNVFKDGQLPYTVPLSSVAPGPDDVVMYLVRGNHFDTLLPKKHCVVPDIKYKKGFATKREAEKYDEKLKKAAAKEKLKKAAATKREAEAAAKEELKKAAATKREAKKYDEKLKKAAAKEKLKAAANSATYESAGIDSKTIEGKTS